MTKDTAVAITLGKGNDFGIDKDGDMYVGRDSEPGSRIYLGIASVQNLNRIIQHMNQLRIHMVYEDPDKENKHDLSK